MADVYTMNKCTYCQEDIIGLRVQCCECEDFVLCLLCFAAGAEIGSHKNDHSYKFTDDWPNILVFKGDGDWVGSEELRLLNNIEVLGYGNWDGVSAIMNNRTPEEVKEHYNSKYLDGVIGRSTWNGITRPELKEHEKLEEKKPFSSLPPLDITPEEAQLLSYMPKRDDFDREASTDIEAEQLVSSLNGVSIDNEVLDRSLKLAQVDMYMRRLRERARRKRIVRDYQLVEKFFATHPHRKHLAKPSLTKEQREFRDRMRVYSQFSTATEHESLIAGLEREQELHLRLNELARYREAGLVHMDECLHYEQHLSFERKGSSVGNTPTNTATPATHQWKHAKSGSSGLGPYFPETQLTGKRKNEDDSYLTGQKFMRPTEDTYIKENRVQMAQSTILQLPQASQQMNHNRDSVNNKQLANASDLLSNNEKQLCYNLNLNPIQYTTLKTVILRSQQGGDIKSEPYSSVDVAVSNNNPWSTHCINTITNYLESSGWLL